jgi:hypothetical protein
VFSCASNSSRLATSGFSGIEGMVAKNFFTRGSSRGSFAILDVFGVKPIEVSFDIAVPFRSK